MHNHCCVPNSGLRDLGIKRSGPPLSRLFVVTNHGEGRERELALEYGGRPDGVRLCLSGRRSLNEVSRIITPHEDYRLTGDDAARSFVEQ
jgi:hypothetical protein